ncbi:MAG TPA: glutamine-hydrolyzing carbamoyl-phosphate synthase small subunit [Patescibacteria group bacterium]|nr:glutamine-hydrolyzing carbamoyl-phosphate synthase small subunit [Patescibacteria group bacterium]
MTGKLILEDGTILKGESFGSENSTAGEVVFSTGMVGYPESLTDPSYKGQILIFTYPLIGNYGVPDKKYWESDSLKISGLIVSNYIDTPSHFKSKQTLSNLLKEEKIPALEISDTRFLAKKIREKGTVLGKIIFNNDIPFYNPDLDNLVSKVSIQKPITKGSGIKTIAMLDCGAKKNIERCFLKRGVKLIILPWNFDPFKNGLKFDGLFISNGPGNPKKVIRTIEIIKKALNKKIPIFGICLGNQLLALAAGGNTKKLKYGHRSQNQPCILKNTNRCYITTQNHGFEVSKVPPGFETWFINANDNSNEGIIHKTLPFMSIQFHPEAAAGPTDTEWIFDYFLKKI